MSYSEVWLNGNYVGEWPYGYSSWALDLTPFIRPGQENVLAIRLDNKPNSSRWYPGGGIYRNIWLTKTSPVHVAHWGTQVSTKTAGSNTQVSARTTVQNQGAQARQVLVTSTILDADSKAVATVRSRQALPAGASGWRFAHPGGAPRFKGRAEVVAEGPAPLHAGLAGDEWGAGA
jgi:beta-galactosidase